MPKKKTPVNLADVPEDLSLWGGRAVYPQDALYGPQEAPCARRRERPLYYFAYGSNMNRERAAKRIPGAKVVGRGVLYGFGLRQCLYADIALQKYATVEGVVYRVTPLHLRDLDRYEGAPRTYWRLRVPVECGRRDIVCWTYVMTMATHRSRLGMEYPPWYRVMCSIGARQHGVRDDFMPEWREWPE